MNGSAPDPGPMGFTIRRTAGAGGPDEQPPRRPATRRLLFIVAAVAVCLFAVAAVVVALRADSPDPDVEQDDALDGLVYSFASPPVPCCAEERNEGTGVFTVEGPWTVDWRVTTEPERDDRTDDQRCTVLGRVFDPDAMRSTELPTFEGASEGSIEYREPGRYSVSLTYTCPADATARSQIRIFETPT